MRINAYNKAVRRYTVKRKDLIRLLEQNGFSLAREGGNHSVYVKEKTFIPIPRHAEVNEQLAKAIIRKNNLEAKK